MIVRDNMSVWTTLTTLTGSVLPQVTPKVLFMSAWATIVVAIHAFGWATFVSINPAALTLLGAILAIATGFRNSAAYDRWWEARKLLGLVVIDTRSLARLSSNYIVGPDDGMQRRMALRCIAFGQVLADFLRGLPIREETAKYLPPDECHALKNSRNGPNRLLDFFSRDIAQAVGAGRLAPEIALAFEDRVASLSVGSASAERTKTTPIPFIYSLGIHRVCYIFCFLLPLGLTETNRYWTILLTAIISYSFFGLDAIGEEMSKPFSRSPHALPLDAIATVIEINILQSLGDEDVPAWPKPTRFVLN